MDLFSLTDLSPSKACDRSSTPATSILIYATSSIIQMIQ